MNLKMTLANVELLPASIVERNINSLIYTIRRPMILEAVKAEPNLTIICTLYQLDTLVSEMAPSKVHSLDSTALFVLGAQPDDRDEKTRRDAARQRLMRAVADGRVQAPRSAAEIEKLINLDLQRQEDSIADNFGRAVDAVRLIESCHAQDLDDEVEDDQAELPEWIADAIHDKVLDLAIRTYSEATRALARNPAEFSQAFVKAQAAKHGAVQLLDKLGIAEAQVVAWAEKRLSNTEALFKRLEAIETPAPTIDEPAPSVTTYVDPSTGRKVHRTSKKAAKGVTSSDLGAAASAK